MAKRRTKHLPMEIAEIVLLKLPAKSLLRFQTLSKEYLAMIRDPRFCRTHSELLSRKNHFLVLSRKDQGGYNYCLAKFEDQKFRLEKQEASTNLPVGSDFRLMCSCNDTVLFGRRAHNVYDKYLLWSPMINSSSSTDHRVIRSPSHRNSVWNHGLCHDRAEGDYKIVLVFWTGRYTVHSCKRGTWSAIKRVSKQLPSLVFDGAGSGVIIDGKLYWIGVARGGGGGGDHGVIYFDPTCDSLNELEGPEDQDDFDEGYHPVMIDLRGHVCFGGDLKLKDVIQFWLLRGGVSWEKTICIDKRSNHITGLMVYGSKCYAVGDDIVIFYRNGTYVIYNTLQDRLVQCSTSPLVGWENLPLLLVLSLTSFFS